MTKPRVLYLDVDDTLLVWTNEHGGRAAPKAKEFIEWADQHLEVRWLTAWCPSGKMQRARAEELAEKFSHKVPPEFFERFTNPKHWIDEKTKAVDFNDPRPWVWVEDRLLTTETKFMQDNRYIDNFYACNVTTNRMVLQSVWRKLAKKFDLPGGPTMPFDRYMEPDPQQIAVDNLIDKISK